MSGLDRIDETLAHLRWRLACGGMSYGEAVTVERFVSMFEHLRSQAVKDLQIDRLDTLMLPWNGSDAIYRGGSS